MDRTVGQMVQEGTTGRWHMTSSTGSGARGPTRVLVGLLVLAFGMVAWAPAAGATHGDTADQQAADASTLVQTDFTTDWTEQPTTADAVAVLQKAMASAGASCKVIGASMKLAATQPHATSSAFTNGGATAQNSVVIFKTPALAAKAQVAFKSAAMQSCLAKVLPTTLPALLGTNPDVGKVASVSVKVRPGKTAAVAAASANWESTAKVKLKNGKTVTVSVNTEGVQDDRSFSIFQFANQGSQQLDGIHDHVMAMSIGRTEGTLGTNALGETPTLAGALLPVEGFSYQEGTPEDQIKNVAHIAANEGVLLGSSDHSIVAGATTVGSIVMDELDPTYASQAGFKDNVIAQFMAADVADFGGTSTNTAVGGRPVGRVDFADGTTGWYFWTKNVMVEIFSAGAAAQVQPFVDAFLAGSPA
jgi:hypothetical protein